MKTKKLLNLKFTELVRGSYSDSLTGLNFNLLFKETLIHGVNEVKFIVVKNSSIDLYEAYLNVSDDFENISVSVVNITNALSRIKFVTASDFNKDYQIINIVRYNKLKDPERGKRILHISHNDNDGYSCSYIVKHMIEPDNTLIQFNIGYEQIEETLNILSQLNTCVINELIITDIGLSDYYMSRLKEIVKTKRIKTKIYDHHQVTSNYKSEDYFDVYYNSTLSACGMLVDLEAETLTNLSFFDKLYTFAMHVSNWDTFKWIEENDNVARGLNILFEHYGPHVYLDIIHNYIMTHNKSSIFSSEDEAIISLYESNTEKRINYLNGVMKVITVKSGMNDGISYEVGAVACEDDVSYIGNRLSEMNKHLDFIALTNFNKRSISLRTVHDGINLGKITKIYGGGGHPKASGLPLNFNTIVFTPISNM